MNKNSVNKLIIAAVCLLKLSACTTLSVDHIKLEDSLVLSDGEGVVVLGRHHSAEFETEASLVSCVGDKLNAHQSDIRVIRQADFVNQFYPWFEARTAPLHPKKLRKVLDRPLVADKISMLNIRYFVWIEGSTEVTNSSGSMGCTIGPGVAGCLGFGAWEDTSDYELKIWDMNLIKEVGRISTEAVGNSYLPAFIVPIPLLAGVEGDACNGMSKQLLNYFVQDETN